MKSWLSIPSDHDFSIYNIPFGIFSDNSNSSKRAGAALGDYIVDLNALYHHGYFSDISAITHNVFEKHVLNDFLQLGNETCEKVRKKIQDLFSEHKSAAQPHVGVRAQNDSVPQNGVSFKERTDIHSNILISAKHSRLFLPIAVRDYVEFYSIVSHATNVGKLFRDEKNPLLPNWKYIPVGYHGRGSSIVVSGTKIIRPHGQLKKNESEPPIYAPSEQLDFELEVAFITNKKNDIGNTLTPLQSSEHIFWINIIQRLVCKRYSKMGICTARAFSGKKFCKHNVSLDCFSGSTQTICHSTSHAKRCS